MKKPYPSHFAGVIGTNTEVALAAMRAVVSNVKAGNTVCVEFNSPRWQALLGSLVADLIGERTDATLFVSNLGDCRFQFLRIDSKGGAA